MKSTQTAGKLSGTRSPGDTKAQTRSSHSDSSGRQSLVRKLHEVQDWNFLTAWSAEIVQWHVALAAGNISFTYTSFLNTRAQIGVLKLQISVKANRALFSLSVIPASSHILKYLQWPNWGLFAVFFFFFNEEKSLFLCLVLGAHRGDVHLVCINTVHFTPCSYSSSSVNCSVGKKNCSNFSFSSVTVQHQALTPSCPVNW